LPVLEAFWESGDSFLERVLLMGSRGFVNWGSCLRQTGWIIPSFGQAPPSASSTFGGRAQPPLILTLHMFVGDRPDWAAGASIQIWNGCAFFKFIHLRRTSSTFGGQVPPSAKVLLRPSSSYGQAQSPVLWTLKNVLDMIRSTAIKRNTI